jgi:TRAP-type C4-dicarboxylate transport system substrate-binding protein
METKKRFPRVIIVFAAFIVMLALGFPGAVYSGTIKLKITHIFPPTDFTHLLLKEWAEKIEHQTGGKVKFTIYPVGALCPPPETYASLAKGIADVACAPDGTSPDQFPLVIGMTQCMPGFPSATVGTRIRNELYEKFPVAYEEFKDVYFLWGISIPPSNLHTRTPVHKLQDVKGMKIRAPRGAVDWIKAIGAVPVSIHSSEIYENIQKGIVDGATISNDALKDWRLSDVTKYTNEIGLYGGGFYMIMNLKKWNSLPPDVQKVIDSLRPWGEMEHAKRFDAAAAAGKQHAIDKGHVFITPSLEEKQEFYNAVKPVYDAWAKKMESKGYPARKILEEETRLLKKYSE